MPSMQFLPREPMYLATCMTDETLALGLEIPGALEHPLPPGSSFPNGTEDISCIVNENHTWSPPCLQELGGVLCHLI